MPDRDHDVSGLTAAQLQRARRDLQVSLALAFPGSPVREPILAQMSAIDAELAARRKSHLEVATLTGPTATRTSHPDHHQRRIVRDSRPVSLTRMCAMSSSVRKHLLSCRLDRAIEPSSHRAIGPSGHSGIRRAARPQSPGRGPAAATPPPGGGVPPG